MGRCRVHREGDEDGVEHEDHEQQVLDGRKFSQSASPLSLRSPHSRSQRLHSSYPYLRGRVPRFYQHRRDLVSLVSPQVFFR